MIFPYTSSLDGNELVPRLTKNMASGFIKASVSTVTITTDVNLSFRTACITASVATAKASTASTSVAAAATTSTENAF
jgi:hypothetical protein